MHLDRLLAAGMDQGATFVLHEVLRRRREPGCVLCLRLGPFLRPSANRGGEMAHPVQDLLRPHRQPMIGLGADQGRRALDRVDPAHLAAGFVRAAPRGKSLYVTFTSIHDEAAER